MASSRTVRIHDIPLSVTQAELETRVAALASGYNPSIIRRLVTHARKTGQGANFDSQSSLAVQGTEQVATVTLTSTNVKSHVIRLQKELGGWHLDDHFRGLTILNSPTDHEVDICAIHGLNGNAFDTWMSTTTMWLRDLLPTSPPFENSRVMTFGYNAGLSDRSVSIGVRQWAIELLNQLSLARSSDKDRSRPLMIVCHSLGGLVGREAMIRLGNFPEQYANVSLDQCGLLFLGTPHSGTREADWNEAFVAISELAFGIRSRDIVDKLRAFNDPSVASKEAFAALNPLPPYFCFFEGKNTKVLGSYRKVVSQDSASLNGVTAVAIPDADHNEICKFERKDGAYLLVMDRLASLRKALLAVNGQTQVSISDARHVSSRLQHHESLQSTGRGSASPNAGTTTKFGAVTASGGSYVSQIGSSNTTNILR